MDDEGRSKDYAVVHFRIEEGMEKAVQALNKHTLKGKDLYDEDIRRTIH
jgi:RNA recognition motif-containing protein